MSYGDGGYAAADPLDPNYFYGEYVYLMIQRSTNGGLKAGYIYHGSRFVGVRSQQQRNIILLARNELVIGVVLSSSSTA